MQDKEKRIEEMLSRIQHLDFIKPGMIPDIDLYMDQVTTFMDTHMARTKRNAEDKILTKTMINNYAKNNLLPPPHKKKYSREHMLMLTFIYYYKNLLSISDIQTLLQPITEQYFQGKGGMNINGIYERVYASCRSVLKQEMQHLVEIVEKVDQDNQDLPEDVQQFSLLCTLGFEMYLRKIVMEQLLDQMHEKQLQIKKENKVKGEPPHQEE